MSRRALGTLSLLIGLFLAGCAAGTTATPAPPTPETSPSPPAATAVSLVPLAAQPGGIPPTPTQVPPTRTPEPSPTATPPPPTATATPPPPTATPFLPTATPPPTQAPPSPPPAANTGGDLLPTAAGLGRAAVDPQEKLDQAIELIRERPGFADQYARLLALPPKLVDLPDGTVGMYRSPPERIEIDTRWVVAAPIELLATTLVHEGTHAQLIGVQKQVCRSDCHVYANGTLEDELPAYAAEVRFWIALGDAGRQPRQGPGVASTNAMTRAYKQGDATFRQFITQLLKGS